MDINATLLGQMITFAVLVWFVKRFLWGPLTQMMQDRQARIADGLAAAERGQHEQELAEKRAKELLHQAKDQAAEIIAQGQKRSNEIIEEAKDQARQEGDRLLAAAQAEIEQEANRAREQMREQVITLAMAGAEKILAREIDQEAHKGILDEVAGQI
ncbi:MAG: F0F1 ATP synthase subunit B [Chromatiales bacterium]|nr:F0F1 ATP synthase subunit B [Chromatiales bacterium]